MGKIVLKLWIFVASVMPLSTFLFGPTMHVADLTIAKHLLYRDMLSQKLQDSDLLRFTQCRAASNFSDAEYLHNIRVSI